MKENYMLRIERHTHRDVHTWLLFRRFSFKSSPPVDFWRVVRAGQEVSWRVSQLNLPPLEGSLNNMKSMSWKLITRDWECMRCDVNGVLKHTLRAKRYGCNCKRQCAAWLGALRVQHLQLSWHSSTQLSPNEWSIPAPAIEMKNLNHYLKPISFYPIRHACNRILTHIWILLNLIFKKSGQKSVFHLQLAFSQICHGLNLRLYIFFQFPIRRKA